MHLCPLRNPYRNCKNDRRAQKYGEPGTEEKQRRPQLRIVNEKSYFGDFKIDTMIGKNHKGAIITTNDWCTHIVLTS